tara:strand:+ start:165 stop:380 length:216 start_codon:yes stop_codon:yes gene_type:complete
MIKHLISIALYFFIFISYLKSHESDNGRKIKFPNIKGYKTLVCDLHMHSVFSDGSVWPDIRIEEEKKMVWM